MRRASWAFTTRRVPDDAPQALLDGAITPRAGDLLLARVDALGHHRKLQLPTGRRVNLFEGDEIVVAYGNRYAANQFESVVPRTLGPCHLVAGGGVASKALSWHARIHRGPTLITPLGLLGDGGGEPLSLRDFALPRLVKADADVPPAIAVVGTAMDSGKTSSCAHLVKGLTRAGARVGYAKVTGTGAGGDYWFLVDAGADPVLDFTDAGYVSTYLLPHEEVEEILVTLTSHLADADVDAIVLEIADGVLQPETAALLTSRVFSARVGGVLFAARDAMGAVAGERWLKDRGIHMVGMSGVVSSSPLELHEAQVATGMQIHSREDLETAGTAMAILGQAKRPLGSGNGDGKRLARVHPAAVRKEGTWA